MLSWHQHYNETQLCFNLVLWPVFVGAVLYDFTIYRLSAELAAAMLTAIVTEAELLPSEAWSALD